MQAHSQRPGPTQALGVRKAEPEPPRSKPSCRQIVKTVLEVIRRGTQEDDIAGGAVHVGEAAAVFVPDVAEIARASVL